MRILKPLSGENNRKRGDNMKSKTVKKLAGGLLIGVVNGLFGAGGGIIAVPLLKKGGMQTHTAHASSVAIILPLSVFSLILYIIYGRLKLADGAPYIISGLVGAVGGSLFLKKISGKILHAAFGAMMIYAGVRMFLK